MKILNIASIQYSRIVIFCQKLISEINFKNDKKSYQKISKKLLKTFVNFQNIYNLGRMNKL